jgi:hypothetical protein
MSSYCPPNVNIVTKTAIVACDYLLIPTKADYLSTLGISYLSNSLDNLRRDYNEYVKVDEGKSAKLINPRVLGVIFNMIQVYADSPIARSLEQLLPMNTHSTQISPISEFAIYGLYGDRDIVIPFPYPRKILVSENGWGKTTVLNTLYAVLTGRFFKKLERLPFHQIQVTFDNGSVSISKADLESLQPDDLRKDKYSTFTQQLRESFPIEVLYFTTYRRIEESLQNLGYSIAPPTCNCPVVLSNPGGTMFVPKLNG